MMATAMVFDISARGTVWEYPIYLYECGNTPGSQAIADTFREFLTGSLEHIIKGVAIETRMRSASLRSKVLESFFCLFSPQGPLRTRCPGPVFCGLQPEDTAGP